MPIKLSRQSEEQEGSGSGSGAQTRRDHETRRVTGEKLSARDTSDRSGSRREPGTLRVLNRSRIKKSAIVLVADSATSAPPFGALLFVTSSCHFLAAEVRK